MSLSVIGVGNVPVARDSIAGVGKRMANGASLKDVFGETKEKTVNYAKCATAAAVVGAGTGTAIGLLTKDGFAKKLLSKMPNSIKEGVNKVANSNFVKSFAEGASELLEGAGKYAKQHPALFAAVSAVGVAGVTIAALLQKKCDENTGKIEQKYDDIVDLKNASAKAIEK